VKSYGEVSDGAARLIVAARIEAGLTQRELCSSPLYGQTASRIVHLRVGDVSIDSDTVRVRLGTVEVHLAPPLDQLIRHLTDEATHNPRGGGWVFPGLHAGRPITADWMATRLNAAGLRTASARSTALLDLAAEMPAAFLAGLLGLHPNIAVRWMYASGGEWAGYVAERVAADTTSP